MRLVILLVWSTLHSYAQTGVRPPKKFISEFQVYVGPSILYPRQYFISPAEERAIRPGYTFGASAIHTMGKFEIEGRISVDRKRFYNTEYYPGDTTVVVTGDLRNDYLSFFVVPKYALDKRARFKVGLGAYFSLLQKSETTNSINDLSNRPIYTTRDSMFLYRNNDFGIVTSFSYHFVCAGKYTFGLEVLNTNGLIDINNTSPPSVISISRNNNLTLLLCTILKL